MKIIEIKALENGAHNNENWGTSKIPDGWAVIPDDMVTENFPFGELEAKEVDGVMTVTKWTPGVMPKRESEETPVSPMEQLRADIDYIAIMTGVEL